MRYARLRGRLKERQSHQSAILMLVVSVGFLSASRLSAQTFTTLYSFTGGSDGAQPHAELVLSGSILYGTTSMGGAGGAGSVFAINTNGTGFKVLHSFLGSDGASPYASLLLSGNTLYGTASAGGASGSGVVFVLNTNGTGYNVLYSFTRPSGASGFLGFPTNSDGCFPWGGLIRSGDTLYGTTIRGGATSGQGTVFALSTNGTGFKTLHSFTVADGRGSPTARLSLSGNVLYGTAAGTDAYYGSVFAINTDGTGFKTLHYFTGDTSTNGAWPYAGVIISDETLYGAVLGATSPLSVNSDPIQGAVFMLNTGGTGFTNLHLFTPLSGPNLTNNDGFGPRGTLVLAGDTLYGTAVLGGAASGGTLFAVKTNGTDFTTLYNFIFPGTTGPSPHAGVIVSGTTLYGTTLRGGTLGQGSIFSFSLTPVKPAITQQPLSRTNIAGTAASFTVMATGPAPLSYQWLKGTNAMQQQSNSTLTLTNVSDADSASYSIIVSNAAGSVTSTPATLTVIDAPLITQQPLSRTNIAGTIASFSVMATGTAPLSYQWLKSNSPLAQRTGSTLTLTNVSDADAASYRVLITNIAGKVTSSPANLTILDPPLITKQPLSQTNITGTTATFSVVATGTAPLSYQWFKGASPISQQKSSTLSLTNVSDADAASYSVVITNAAGKVASTAAKLTVTNRPQMTISEVGTNVVLSWATNVAGFELQSSMNLGSGAVWATVSASPVVVDGQKKVTNPVVGTQQFYRLSQ